MYEDQDNNSANGKIEIRTDMVEVKEWIKSYYGQTIFKIVWVPEGK